LHVGWNSREEARAHLDDLLNRIERTFPEDIAEAMPQELASLLRTRTQASIRYFRDQA
jgi:polyhydroxyalkanoate synthesis regulator phasin